jgi:hypothetical protein
MTCDDALCNSSLAHAGASAYRPYYPPPACGYYAYSPYYCEGVVQVDPKRPPGFAREADLI